MDIINYLTGQPLWLAILISVTINIIVSLAGVLPSTFVTGANIIYFGFSGGLAVSIAGEALGAVISFILYRLGIKKLSEKIKRQPSSKFMDKLTAADGSEAMILVFLLRIFPFAPSGLVTLAASLSKMGVAAFALASTLGKIPALIIEAYSVNTVLGWEQEYQAASGIFVLAAFGWYFYRKRRK